MRPQRTPLCPLPQPGGLSAATCPPTPTTPGCLLYRGEFAVVPGRNEMYFWYVDGNSSDQGIWKTTTGGSSWTVVDDTGITSCGDLLGGCGTTQGIFNLALAAVPDGQTTDLYAGAVNLYKCRITTASFLQVNNNTQVVMYFATEGGIYRALDGYTGLTTGTCGGSNQFDSLNETLGSMTQFVSFSQHPSDPNTILGGAEDNGSPATSTSQSSTSWLNVNAGDGGFNEINPDNPTEWFTANTDVSIQRCELGVDCRVQDFDNGLVVSNTTVGGIPERFSLPSFWTRKTRENSSWELAGCGAGPAMVPGSRSSPTISRREERRAVLAVRSTWCGRWPRAASRARAGFPT